MSSSMSAGYWTNEAQKERETPCPKSKDEKHEWVTKATGPSSWQQCKHCGSNIYGK